MSKFKKKTKFGLAPISTASLPDIVFMILFFFMVSTKMKEIDYKVKINLPSATEIKKLENKSLVSYIFIGQPLPAFQSKYGTEPMIQLNDKLSQVSDIYNYIMAERQLKGEDMEALLTTSLKIDNETEMGIVSDVKQELRKVQALKINYTTSNKVEKK